MRDRWQRQCEQVLIENKKLRAVKEAAAIVAANSYALRDDVIELKKALEKCDE